MATTPRPLADYFAELRDPRVQLKCVHEFMDMGAIGFQTELTRPRRSRTSVSGWSESAPVRA